MITTFPLIALRTSHLGDWATTIIRRPSGICHRCYHLPKWEFLHVWKTRSFVSLQRRWVPLEIRQMLWCQTSWSTESSKNISQQCHRSWTLMKIESDQLADFLGHSTTVYLKELCNLLEWAKCYWLWRRVQRDDIEIHPEGLGMLRCLFRQFAMEHC